MSANNKMKILVLLYILTLSLCVLTTCGRNENPTQENEKDEPTDRYFVAKKIVTLYENPEITEYDLVNLKSYSYSKSNDVIIVKEINQKGEVVRSEFNPEDGLTNTSNVSVFAHREDNEDGIVVVGDNPPEQWGRAEYYKYYLDEKGYITKLEVKNENLEVILYENGHRKEWWINDIITQYNEYKYDEFGNYTEYKDYIYSNLDEDFYLSNESGTINTCYKIESEQNIIIGCFERKYDNPTTIGINYAILYHEVSKEEYFDWFLLSHSSYQSVGPWAIIIDSDKKRTTLEEYNFDERRAIYNKVIGEIPEYFEFFSDELIIPSTLSKL